MFALQLLKVPAADLAQSEAFWTAVLHRGPVEGSVAEGALRYDVDGLDILLYPGARPGGALHFDLNHDDLDAVMARLPETSAPRIVGGNGDRRIEARDPAGNLVRIFWRAPSR